MANSTDLNLAHSQTPVEETPETLEKFRRKMRESMTSIRSCVDNISKTLTSEVLYNKNVLGTVATMLEDGMVLLDKQHRITIFNPSAASIFGVDAESVIGKSFAQLFPSLMNKFEKDISVNNIYSVDPQSGAPLYYDMSLSKVEAKSNGQEDYSLILARSNPINPSDSFGQDQRLLELTSVHNLMLWGFPLPIVYSDGNGFNLNASKEFYDIFGLTRHELMSKSLTDVFGSELGSWMLKSKDMTKTVEVNTLTGKHKFTVHRSIIKDGSSAVVAYIACFVGHEINHDNEYVLNFVKTLDSFEQSVALISVSEGRILLVNKSFCDTYGYSRADILNTNIDLLSLTPTNRISILRNFLKGKEWEGDIRICKQDGHIVKDRLKVIPINIDRSDSKLPKYCLIAQV